MSLLPSDYNNNAFSISTYDFITVLVKDTFGTYFVESNSWKVVDVDETVGRTYFVDQKRSECPVSDKTVDNILLLYFMALAGDSIFDPVQLSQNFAQALKNSFKINVDFLIFYDDDTEALRQNKKQFITHLVFMLLSKIKNRECVSAREVSAWNNGEPTQKLLKWIAYVCEMP